MRIIAGVRKGIRLTSCRHPSVRPTTDRVKETIFNVLGDTPRTAVVLDLFAGTGSLGIEALSRGAARAIFVEKHPAAQKAITQNIQRTGFADNTSLLRMPVKRAIVFLARQQMKFDLIFADPPYADNIINNTIGDITRHNIIKPGGWLVFEHSSHAEIQDAITKFSCQVKKIQGETEVTFFQNG